MLLTLMTWLPLAVKLSPLCHFTFGRNLKV